jgi:starch phosphorylase
MRESLAQLTPRFSADRTVRDYTETHYLPAANNYLKRAAGKGAQAKIIRNQLEDLKQKWDAIRFGDVKVETYAEQLNFEVQVFLNDLDPDVVQVELFADSISGETPFIKKLSLLEKAENSDNAYLYSASVASTRPALDFTARVIPYLPGVALPLEFSSIIWQR